MTAGLQPYPEYKDSGLPWVNRIPARWEEKRAKFYFREVDERSTTGTEQLLSVSHKTGVTPRKANVTMFMAESNVGCKICRPGDLVINTMWAWMAAMGVSRQTGLVSPSYGVYRPRKALPFLPDYVDHLVRTQPYVSEYICRSTGIRPSRLRLYPNDFLDIPIVCPPHEEQEAIVRFIDHHDRLVRRFIRNRRRLIEVLNEQKLAIIDQAVTCGLDPDVSFKPSDISWLGKIPEHWEAVRLKNIANVVLGKMLKTSPSPGYKLRQYLRSANIQWWTPRLDDVAEMWFSDPEMEVYRLASGDILVSEGGEAGRACLWEGQIGECYIQNSVHKVTPGEEIRSRFLLFQFFIMGQSGHFGSIVNRVSIAHLTREKLVAVWFVVPPLSEQDEIIAFVEQNTTTINAAIQRVKCEIDLIREYRTRLIADVVTGKVDVRHLAPLPEAVEVEAEPDDLDDEMPGEDEAGLSEEVADADD
jgi:type I restriction enzyme, S subunit